MKVFIDTNVLIDIVASREPFLADSQAVYSLCVTGEIEGFVSDLTFCNLAYIMRKQLDAERLRECLRRFRSHLGIVSVGAQVIDQAIEGFSQDFEDSIQACAAIAAQADCLVTRNVRHFKNIGIPVYTPTDFLMLG